MIDKNGSSFKNTTLGIGAGALTYASIDTFGKLIYQKNIFKHFNDFSKEENLTLKQTLYDVFENSGLKEKGVSINHVDPENLASFLKNYDSKSPLSSNPINNICNNSLSSSFGKVKNKKFTDFVNKFSKQNKKSWLLEKQNKRIEKNIELAAKAKNAFYHPKKKRIVLNTKDFPFAGFHEMGHAINHNGLSKVGKFLYSIRHPFAILPLVFLGVGLLKKEKKNGEKPVGFWDKTTTFIKDNCGKLSILALLPKVAEEGLASVNAYKLIKNVLPKDLVKKVCKSNMLAFGSYVVGLITTGLASCLAIKMKDKIAQG